jgi:L-ascorbate metabolism protein UlaG (beta-lactamase superfamily)
MRASRFPLPGRSGTTIPASPFDALPKIDVVLVSHGHYDHLDIATLSKLTENFRRA